ncbi:hypothetical protein NDU88_007411 [Pleurodeles waltl]|uniref:Uncharacterized protein n=1 Tax=Pleurodeles waltl TaxID=8319 RepID=A0AAV7RV07_PLEWA|nr:hypothetical protein NDU88_007411 [Pleurodeles waltl]
MECRACRRVENKPDAYRIIYYAVPAADRTPCLSACRQKNPTSVVLCLSARSKLTGRWQNAVSVGALKVETNVRCAVPISAYQIDRLLAERRVCRRVDRKIQRPLCCACQRVVN